MPWSPAVSCAGIRCRPGAVLTPEAGRAVRPLAPRSPGVARPCQAPLVAKLLPDGRYSRPTDNLTQQKTPPERGFLWSGRRGSNPRPSAWEADALPTELRPRWAAILEAARGHGSTLGRGEAALRGGGSRRRR